MAVGPSFSSFESLAGNLVLNHMLGFVTPIQAARLDRTGLETMHYTSVQAGASLHSVGVAEDYLGRPFTAVETQLVPTFRLDALADMLGLPAPTRMKVDVDGFELHVLAGADALLARGSLHSMMIEIVNHDGQHTRLAAVRALLARHGYASAKTHLHRPETDGTPSPVADYLFSRAGLEEAGRP